LDQKLTIIIACFNEAKTIAKILEKINTLELINQIKKEIIIVDDASTDNTVFIIENYQNDFPNIYTQLYRQTKNSGKGSCIKLGIEKATGSFIVIQDADLEYDPMDYNRMLKPILDENADVVYGSRFSGSEPHRVLFFLHTIGNNFLTFLSNLFTNINLTDMETGYKMFRADILKQINLREKRFGFEPEVTAKISRITGVRIYEVGISYFGRTYEEGKKIKWKDGFRAIYCIIKYNIFSRK
jgi:glycosyltransferase involved in cell wall biosynthesis